MATISRRRSLYGFETNVDDPDVRRKDATRKTHDIKQLWQRNHEILRLAVLGHKAPEIASLLNITTQTVSNTLNSELGMQKLSALRLERDSEAVEVSKEVARLFPLAIKTYEKILENEQAPLSLQKEVADTVLMDIGGYRAPTKIQGQVAHAHLVKHEIEAIKARGRAAAAASGMLVDNEGNKLTAQQVIDVDVIDRSSEGRRSGYEGNCDEGNCDVDLVVETTGTNTVDVVSKYANL